MFITCQTLIPARVDEGLALELLEVLLESCAGRWRWTSEQFIPHCLLKRVQRFGQRSMSWA